jgi:hypothetical protein
MEAIQASLAASIAPALYLSERKARAYHVMVTETTRGYNAEASSFTSSRQNVIKLYGNRAKFHGRLMCWVCIAEASFSVNRQALPAGHRPQTLTQATYPGCI